MDMNIRGTTAQVCQVEVPSALEILPLVPPTIVPAYQAEVLLAHGTLQLGQALGIFRC